MNVTLREVGFAGGSEFHRVGEPSFDGSGSGWRLREWQAGWTPSGCRSTRRCRTRHTIGTGRCGPAPGDVSVIRAVVGASDGDDDLPSSVSRSDMSHSLRGLAERVRSVDDRCDLAGFDELPEGDQILPRWCCHKRAPLPGQER